MSEEVRDSTEIKYIPKDVVDIIGEFRNMYSKLDSKIKQFVRTQPTFLNEIRQKLKTDIAFLSPQKKDMALSIYGIIITEDILKSYEPHFFADDISSLLNATDKKMSCTDDEFIGLLASFINILKSIRKSTEIIIQNFADLRIKGIQSDVIETLLIQRNFSPALSEANLHFEVGEFEIDMRYLVAIFAYFIELSLEKSEIIDNAESAGKLYAKAISKYPISKGEDILYDMINTILVEPYLSQLSQTLTSPTEVSQVIQKGKIDRFEPEEEIVTQPAFIQGRIEKVLRIFQDSLSKRLKVGKEVDESWKMQIESNIEMILDWKAVNEFGKKDLDEQHHYLRYLFDIWFEVFEEYPQMSLPIIEIEQFTKFIDDPKIFMEETKKAITHKLKNILQEKTKDDGFTPRSLAVAFTAISFELLTNPDVLSITFGE
ncbi:MAG: hypothetical protein KAS63_09170 [Candidatus Heimdallarchaeota archaeon]|nr:hypothetical protein [Candidatus Heimdallarchaeota archaeon]MCK4955520.1 hypothetical protein [Candidatus Heimdallarchaeota archaeon]